MIKDILGHWFAGGLVLEADRFGIDQLASAGDHHNGAGHAIGIDLLLQYRPNTGEPVLRNIDGYGRYGRQYLAKSVASEDQGRRDKQQSKHSFHALPPLFVAFAQWERVGGDDVLSNVF